MRRVVNAAFVVLLLVASQMVGASKSEEAKEFVIYTEAGSRLNHYIPSGWMGDFGDLRFNPRSKTKAFKGATAIEISYSAERKQGAGWSGIYWQTPANNWGDKRGGIDLTGYKTLKFAVKGAKGGELVDKFFIGGITGQTEDGDSDQIETDAIELTTEWKEHSIDLAGLDLSHIIGGFGFALNGDSNPQGAAFYLDEIRLEK